MIKIFFKLFKFTFLKSYRQDIRSSIFPLSNANYPLASSDAKSVHHSNGAAFGYNLSQFPAAT